MLQKPRKWSAFAGTRGGGSLKWQCWADALLVSSARAFSSNDVPGNQLRKTTVRSTEPAKLSRLTNTSLAYRSYGQDQVTGMEYWRLEQHDLEICNTPTRGVFVWWKSLSFGTVAHFIVTWQVMSNYELIWLRRFISCLSVILCN